MATLVSVACVFAASPAAVSSRTVALPGRSLQMEYVVAEPTAPRKPAGPPLVLVHGTFHASWAFAEHWVPHLADKGLTVYAVSLRGTSPSPLPQPRKVRVDEHVDDLAQFLREVVRVPPVLVGHSFGGAYVQRFLERDVAPVAGAVLLCSVPPSGTSRMILRFLRRRPLAALLITRGLALRTATKSVADASKIFFSGALPEVEVARYVERFAADSLCGLDLGDFNRKLPARERDGEGRATWLARRPLMLAVGAEQDAIVDKDGLRETAAFYDCDLQMLEGMGHDVMLLPGWERAADLICNWTTSETG